MRAVKIMVVAIVFALLTGCVATGPLYSDISASIPPIPADKGRIYFYRSDTVFGAAVTSDISLNGKVVGRSERASVFYVDQAPGNCVVSTSTEVEKQLTFTLAANETRYVHTSVSMGVLVGRINAKLVNAEEAKSEIASLHYIGGPAQK
jgi:predicted small lipoprotein YifL